MGTVMYSATISTIAVPPSSDPRALIIAARKIAMDRLAERERSRHELREALARRRIPDDVASAVIDDLADQGFVDDARFAALWVTSRQRSKGLAPTALRLELERKGVDREHIDAALAEVDEQAQHEAATRLVDRKLRSMADLPNEVAFRRLAAMLGRKGYPPHVAIAVVRTALEQ